MINTNYNPTPVHLPAAVVQPPSEQQIPLHLLDSLKTDPTFKNKRNLEREFRSLSVEQLAPLLEQYCTHLLESQGDLINSIHKLAALIPYEKLEEAIRVQHPQHKDALINAKNTLEKAKHFLELTEKNSMPLEARVQRVLNSMVNCLESIITAFGVADFFMPLEAGMQPHTKAQRIFSLISLFGILTAALLPLLGPAIAVPVVASVLLIIALLSLIYPRIKPMPHRIPKAENWSQQIREKQLQTVEVSKEYLDQIADALTNGKKHPMLIGKSGIGKTETAKAFAKAVEEGLYPKLKGKKVFYINAADLLSGGNDGKELKKISEVMGRHRKNIILVFDEIHVLCQMNHNLAAEQLKRLLENSSKGFPHVIGITTEQEFYRDIYRNNAAFARRFKEISIKNPSEKKLMVMLKKMTERKDPLAWIEEGAIEHLLKETKSAFPEDVQPGTAITILNQCFKELSEIQIDDLTKEIFEVEQEIAKLKEENILEEGNGLLPDHEKNKEAMERLELQLFLLEEKLSSYKREIQTFYNTKKQLNQVKKAGFQNIVKISKLSKKLGHSDKNLLNEYLLQSYFLSEALEKNIRQNAKKLNVHASINPSLIDKVIASEIENQNRVKQIIDAGREDLNARSRGFEKAAAE